jgi:hypothetical protein
MSGDLFRTPQEQGLAARLGCVKRELGYRRRVYPRLVRDNRMTQADADQEIALMTGVLADLEALARAVEVISAARAVRDQNGAMLDPALAVDLDRALGAYDRFTR